jgi:hypothetical protein
MATGRRARAWLRRWVGNPVASVVLLAGLVGDSFTLGRDWRYTPLGGPVNAVFGKARTAPTVLDPWGPELYVVRSGGDFRVIDPSVESWDELSSLLSAGDVPIVACVFTEHNWRRGFWATTSQQHSRRVAMAPTSGDWSDSDLAAARSVLFHQERVPALTWSSIQPWVDVSEADHRKIRVLWGGVFHDVLALGVLLLLLYSIARWPAWFAAHPLSRRARRIARGLCPSCGYDLRGIEACLCPECGRPLTLDSP